MKKLFGIIFLFIFLFNSTNVLAQSNSKTEQRVFDNAGLLSDTQKEFLNDKCLKMGDELSLDIILLTINDAKGKTSTAYADDFYDDMEFGYNAPHGDGILLLIDMDNRELSISTSGTAISYFTDNRINSVFDVIAEYISDGKYYNGCDEFIDLVKQYMSSKPASSHVSTGNGYNGQNSYSVFLTWWFQLIVSLVIAGIIVGVMAYNFGGKVTVNMNTYLDASGTHHISSYDNYIKTVTTSVKKTPPPNSGGGSSTHKSSGGHTHGGGSRKF